MQSTVVLQLHRAADVTVEFLVLFSFVLFNIMFIFYIYFFVGILPVI